MRIGPWLAAVAVGALLSSSAQGQDAPPPPPPTAAVAPPAEPPPAPPHHLDKCPANIGDFENSDATSKLVERCLGRSHEVRPGRGSDTIWIYSASGGTVMLVFVFDATGAMTHFRAYAHN